MLDQKNRLSRFFYFVIPPTRCLSGIIGVLIGLIPFNHPAQADDGAVPPARVLSVVTADWNSDGSFDRAILIESEAEPDRADLLVYLSDASDKMRLAVSKKSIAWHGAMWGTQPALEVTDRGSLIITSANEAIGRNRWTQKLTVVYRDNSFVVAGYTYAERDTLDPDANVSCDINLLTGGGVKNGKPFKTSVKTVTLTDWSEASIPQQCQ